MAIVTLTTDLGKNNHIISLIKGSLLHGEPMPVIIDISHEINSFDIIQAAFIVAQSWRAFPLEPFMLWPLMIYLRHILIG